jgi:hypothetical protein
VDVKDLIRQGYANEPKARNLAHDLTDAALDYLGVDGDGRG